MLTIASLTLFEAARRRIVLVGGSASLVVVIGSAWALGRLMGGVPERSIGLTIVSVLSIFLAFLFSVVLALGAAFLAAPAIGGDIENGIALAILPRPISRTAYLMGKWLGLAALLGAYAAMVCTLEYVAIAFTTAYRAPHPLTALAYLIAQALVMLSFALLVSTRLPALAGGLLVVVCFGGAWLAGIVANVAASLHNDNVLHAMTLVALLIPSDILWRGAVYSLQPVALLVASNAGAGSSPNPFGASMPPPPALLAWVTGWNVLALGLAMLSFRTRDI